MTDHRSKGPLSETDEFFSLEELDYYRRNTCVVMEGTRRSKFSSREKAADTLGASPRTVRSWEDGDRGLQVAELIVVAKRWGEDPVDMFKQIIEGKK